MPQIVVISTPADRGQEGAVMLRERVATADFESDHFTNQLVERLGWAVDDAHEAEQTQPADDAVQEADGSVGGDTVTPVEASA